MMDINQNLADYMKSRVKGGKDRRVKKLLTGVKNFGWFVPDQFHMLKKDDKPLVASLSFNPFTISFIFSPDEVRGLMYVPEGPLLLNAEIKAEVTYEEFLGTCLLLYAKSSEEARQHGVPIPKLISFGGQTLITEMGLA